jgi:PiT family inorganic phosphate transporter
LDVTIILFLIGGLFLGWSLGANDAANVFGTAVGTRMVSFALAAVVCSIFVILGAVVSGAGAAHTLGKLGAINTVAGAGMAAAAAAVTVYWMTRLGLPVSTTQAIVGAIIGWNLFTDSPTDTGSLIRILATWVICPVLAGIVGALLFKGSEALVHRMKPHLFRLDAYTRLALILAGAFGAYSLGANNIANVMGVFLFSNPFTTFDSDGGITFSATQQLFLLGGLAIAVGVITYSKRVMITVGQELVPLSPVGAWVVVIAHSIVLFLFASQTLEHWLARSGLPTIPLVPVSSSQVVVGAVIGIGLLKGGKGIRWRVLSKIASGWVTTPIIACLVCFISLFFLQNVFNQKIYEDAPYLLSGPALEYLERSGIDVDPLAPLHGVRFAGLKPFKQALEGKAELDRSTTAEILQVARLEYIKIDPARLDKLDELPLDDSQKDAVRRLAGQSFDYPWMLAEALSKQSPAWRIRPETTVNKLFNRDIVEKRQELYRVFTSR